MMKMYGKTNLSHSRWSKASSRVPYLLAGGWVNDPTLVCEDCIFVMIGARADIEQEGSKSDVAMKKRLVATQASCYYPCVVTFLSPLAKKKPLVKSTKGSIGPMIPAHLKFVLKIKINKLTIALFLLSVWCLLFALRQLLSTYVINAFDR